MASENQWAYDIDSTVLALVRTKAIKQLESSYPKIRVTDEEESDTTAVFPTVLIRMIGGVEKGRTLDGQSINGLNATFQVDVSSNKKTDCKVVNDTITEIFKNMRFESGFPTKTMSNSIYVQSTRFSRVISANDKLI